MNLFDQLGRVTPRTEGGMNRQGFREKQEEQMQGNGRAEGEARESGKKEDGCFRFFKLGYYEEYFRVSEAEVVERVMYSITLPHRSQFIALTNSNPDYYGPFWIMSTLIMLLGFIGNFSNYLLSKFSSEDVWDKYFFQLEFIREAVILVYTIGFGVPVVFYFLLKFMAEKLDIKLPTLICLYGYSMFCFVPAVLLCILPVGLLQWVFLIYSFVNSSVFLIANLQKHLEGISQIVVKSVICGTQFVLLLCLKLIFLQLKG